MPKLSSSLLPANRLTETLFFKGIHQEQKIIIRRRYVVGGSASVVPERAPAKTVSVREDVRSIMLTRYGGKALKTSIWF